MRARNRTVALGSASAAECVAPMAPQRDPWHSLTQNVHHTWDDCSGARKVTLAGAIREGHGGRPLCSECEQLTAKHAASPGPEPPRNPAR
jgi:hypothetical protein